MKWRLVHASRFDALETLQKIETQKDYDQLISDLKGLSYNDLLQRTFARHLNTPGVMDRSGFCPYRLLSATIFLMKFPAVQTIDANDSSEKDSENDDLDL